MDILILEMCIQAWFDPVLFIVIWNKYTMNRVHQKFMICNQLILSKWKFQFKLNDKEKPNLGSSKIIS